jgi:hypothetical protein
MSEGGEHYRYRLRSHMSEGGEHYRYRLRSHMSEGGDSVLSFDTPLTFILRG